MDDKSNFTNGMLTGIIVGVFSACTWAGLGFLGLINEPTPKEFFGLVLLAMPSFSVGNFLLRKFQNE